MFPALLRKFNPRKHNSALAQYHYFCNMVEVFANSNIERLHFSGLGPSCEVDILRDDLIHPVVSGNKWRKLKYIIEAMKDTGKQKLVTFGGAYSNHLVATSFAGRIFGIETFAFVRGNENREPNAFEKLCIKNGMTLMHVDRTAYREKNLLFDSMFSNDPLAEMVGEGGRHPMALPGCSEIITELTQEYDLIVLALGTGTTMEGLLKAVTDKHLKTRILGISSLKNNLELDHIMSEYPRENWQIEHNYHRGKYAKNDSELKTFIDSFQTETGIRLEFVYTGKMMMALCEMIKNGTIEAGQKILCIHTGGLPDLLQ